MGLTDSNVFVIITVPEKNNSDPAWHLNLKNCIRSQLAPKLGWRLLIMLHVPGYPGTASIELELRTSTSGFRCLGIVTVTK